MGVKPLYYSFYNETFYFASNKSTFHGWSSTKMAQMDWKSIFLTDLLLEKILYQNVKKKYCRVMTIHEDGKPLSKVVGLKGNSKPT
jgi:asparagine synthase (glutamine-hydrolysing)